VTIESGKATGGDKATKKGNKAKEQVPIVKLIDDLEPLPFLDSVLSSTETKDF
jgi:hypothetical protein